MNKWIFKLIFLDFDTEIKRFSQCLEGLWNYAGNCYKSFLLVEKKVLTKHLVYTALEPRTS
jgi:hypothetical protein